MSMFFVYLFFLIVTWVVVQSFGHRQNSLPPPDRSCPTCGIPHPEFANYCRRCGRQI